LVVRDTGSKPSDKTLGRGLQAQPGAQVTLRRALLERNRDVGMFAGAAMSLTDVVVRDTRSQENDQVHGDGLHLQEGAQVAVQRAMFERNRRFGVSAVTASTTVLLADVVVRDTQSEEASLGFGRGLHAQEGARVTVTRAVFERNREVGVSAASAGTTVSLADVVVRDTQSREDRTSGRGLAATEGAEITVTRTLVERNREVGVFVETSGTTVSLADVLVRDTQSREKDQTLGAGLLAQNGAQVTVERAAFERNRVAGVETLGHGTTVSLADVVVRDTLWEENGKSFGRGLDAVAGASVTVTRALLERNREVGVGASSGATVSVADVLVLDTLSRKLNHKAGRGLHAQTGAGVTVTRAVIERNREVGVSATSAGTAVSLSDVVVRDTQGQESDNTAGRGLHGDTGAQVMVARAVFERNREVGVMVVSAGTTASLADVVVRDTQCQGGDHKLGRGLNVQEGAHVAVARAVFERNREVGVNAVSAGTALALTDVLVRDTQGRQSDKKFGRGLEADDGAQVAAARIVFARNRELGVGAASASTALALTDLVVRDTQGRESDNTAGRGLHVQEGARVTVTRAMFERNREVGVSAASAGTTATLLDVVVRDTRIRECAESLDGSCRGYGAGIAVDSFAHATVEIVRFELSASPMCAIQVATEGFVTARDGVIHHNAIGVNVQSEGYDLTTIIGPTVRFYENGTNVDSRDLPVPDILHALAPAEQPDAGLP
jgi:uncharacterized membrane protein (UPF0136 family)